MTTSLDRPLEQVLERDRTLVATAIAALTGLAWLYLWRLAVEMGGPSAMEGMAMPAFRPWSAAAFGLALAMWFVMMVGMMMPSAAPVVLLYARVARQAGARGQPFAGSTWFVAGYLVVWLVFSAVATSAQLLLERAALLTPMLATRSDLLGGAVLIVCGLYQWTPIKNACLVQCQSPLTFIQRFGGFEGSPAASLRMGVRHGAYCLGCCWALMVLLFVGGVMNLAWIAAITVVVLLEKVAVRGPWLSRLTGLASVLAGAWLMTRGEG